MLDGRGESTSGTRSGRTAPLWAGVIGAEGVVPSCTNRHCCRAAPSGEQKKGNGISII